MTENCELVMHPFSGVCRLQGVRELEGQKGEYRVLCPLADPNTTLYVPVDSEKIRLRPVMSREEALALISSLPELEPVAVSTMNEKKQRFGEMLKSGDPVQLARLGKTVHLMQCSRSKNGKNACSSDRSAQREGDKLLFGELAAALEIPAAEVPEFIEEHLANRKE